MREWGGNGEVRRWIGRGRGTRYAAVGEDGEGERGVRKRESERVSKGVRERERAEEREEERERPKSGLTQQNEERGARELALTREIMVPWTSRHLCGI